MKNTGLQGCAYYFSVDCDAIAGCDILDIHKYLMKKNEIIVRVEKTLVALRLMKMFRFMKRVFVSTMMFLG